MKQLKNVDLMERRWFPGVYELMVVTSNYQFETIVLINIAGVKSIHNSNHIFYSMALMIYDTIFNEFTN